ncbi:helix-turn-helix domain-containing protein [Halothiobacillus sp.]|uniref:helix-turn-helix domain-containing protein n=1 Tax=Halothiobacillus sp. TaxID=1891311 RepID=UPI00260E486C|nr:helix-turn-helix transcriptional regulator [Halothiobacillus sp.]MDD4965384.1 helix-turn-helix transcriptional regulator [Halothiobacillus sp.]
MNSETFQQLQNRLAKDIKAARRAVGLSQEALALQAEVDRTYVSQLERGIANPSLFVLYRLTNVLGGSLRISLEKPETKDAQ